MKNINFLYLFAIVSFRTSASLRMLGYGPMAKLGDGG
jgi:hypothetical protein